MANLEQIVNQPQEKKGLLRRMGNWIGGTLLAGGLFLGACLPGCIGREEEYEVEDRTPPANVSNFIAADKYLSVDLSWINPTDSDFTGVIIQRKTSSFSVDPTDGTFVYSGTGQSCTDSGVNEGITYFYTIFSYDGVPNYSSGSNDSAKPFGGAFAVGWIGGGSNGWKTFSGASSGSDYQSLNLPRGLSGDSSGNIFVADSFNHRVCKWSSAGNAMGWIGGGSNGWKTTSVALAGSNYQSFNRPTDITIDSIGNIYVADSRNNRISKWTATGNAVGWIGGGSNGWKISSGAGTSNDYQSFSSGNLWVMGLFVDSSGNIFVADYLNHRVCKWDSAGNAIGWIGGGTNGWKTSAGTSWGSDYKSFCGPADVFVDSFSGTLFVTDSSNHRISKWDSAGNAIGWYQKFNLPKGLSVDTFGDMYIADSGNNRISKRDGAGNAIGWIGGSSNGWQTSTAPTSGASDYQSFDYPIGVFVNSGGTIYVADTYNHRISKWQD